jgi:hypothetical protein
MKRYLLGAAITLSVAAPAFAQTAAEYVMKAGAGSHSET